MANIPTIPGTVQVGTPSPAVKLDENALNQPNLAARQLGGAVIDAGRSLGEFAQKMQATVNYGIAAEADRTMRQASADFMASRAGRTDEHDWVNQWNEKANDTWQQIQEKNAIGPALRRQLTQNFKDWQQANGVEVQTMARKQMINRSIERASLAADEAAKDGDERGVREVLEPLAKIGAAYPEQVQAMVKKYTDKIDHYQAATLIDNDPILAEKILNETDKNGKPVNFTRLTPENRLTLQFEAHRLATQQRVETANDFFMRKQNFLAGAGPDVSVDEVRDAVRAGRLTATQAKSFLKAPKAEFNPDKFASLYNDIASYDPAKDVTKKQYSDLMARAAYDPELKGPAASDAVEMLKKKMDPKSEYNTPAAKSGNALIAQNFRLGIYGRTTYRVLDDNPKSDTYGSWITKTDAKGLAQAQRVRAETQTALDKWLADPKNQGATPAQVQEFVAGLNRTGRISSFWAPVINNNLGTVRPDGSINDGEEGP